MATAEVRSILGSAFKYSGDFTLVEVEDGAYAPAGIFSDAAGKVSSAITVRVDVLEELSEDFHRSIYLGFPAEEVTRALDDILNSTEQGLNGAFGSQDIA